MTAEDKKAPGVIRIFSRLGPRIVHLFLNVRVLDGLVSFVWLVQTSPHEVDELLGFN
jgi:hypothetical protein